MFEDIDYDGFKDYCKKILSKNTVPQYQTYLRNFISFLEDNKIYSIFDYYDLKSKNPKYLEEEFLKSGKTKKSFADYNSAVSKYIEFINSKGITMPITDKEQQRSKTNFSLNQILYGPPGTGKTYKLSKIMDKFTQNLNVKSSGDTDALYEMLKIETYTWCQVAAAILYDAAESNTNGG